MYKFLTEYKLFLIESGMGFYKKEYGEDAIKSLNMGQEGDPFKLVKVGDYWIIKHDGKTVNESYFNNIKIYDRVWVMPGEGKTANVWSLGKQYKVKKKDGKYKATTTDITNKPKKTKIPKTAMRPEVKKAIDFAIECDENTIFSGVEKRPPKIARRAALERNKKKNKHLKRKKV